MHSATAHAKNLASPPVGVELFKGLTDAQQSLVLSSGSFNRFEPHEVIIRSDDAALRLYLLRSGHANFSRIVKTGEQILLARLVPGDIFGLGSMVAEPLRYIGTAETVDTCEVINWERDTIRRIAATHPTLAQNAFCIALRYVREFIKRHLALVANSAEERLAYTLTQLGSRSGHMLSDGLELNIKNEDLASLADISVFTASRFLKRWERKGALEKSRGKVLIRCPEKLLVA